MSKLSKLERSNRAHYRLFHKHIVIFSRDSSLKADYHDLVARLQSQSGKVMTKKDRKTIYDHEYDRVYGQYPKGSKTTRKAWTDVVRKYSKK